MPNVYSKGSGSKVYWIRFEALHKFMIFRVKVTVLVIVAVSLVLAADV